MVFRSQTRFAITSALASRARGQGFFLLLLPLLLLLLLGGGGFGFSMIFGFSFGGRLSLLFFCANAHPATVAAISIANRIRFSCFITALLLASFSPTHWGRRRVAPPRVEQKRCQDPTDSETEMRRNVRERPNLHPYSLKSSSTDADPDCVTKRRARTLSRRFRTVSCNARR